MNAEYGPSPAQEPGSLTDTEQAAFNNIRDGYGDTVTPASLVDETTPDQTAGRTPFDDIKDNL